MFVGKPGDRVAGKPAEACSRTPNSSWRISSRPFVDPVCLGILERHPKLKLVMAEAGTGWLPWLVQELDYRHWRLWEAKDFWADKGGIALETKPSELFKRQIYATFQEDYAAMALIPFFGEGHLLWASDYPHPDSVWPNSRAAIVGRCGIFLRRCGKSSPMTTPRISMLCREAGSKPVPDRGGRLGGLGPSDDSSALCDPDVYRPMPLDQPAMPSAARLGLLDRQRVLRHLIAPCLLQIILPSASSASSRG